MEEMRASSMPNFFDINKWYTILGSVYTDIAYVLHVLLLANSTIVLTIISHCSIK